jgi:hypothetical protein
MADKTQQVKNLTKELNDYISNNLSLNYCKSLIKAIEYRFKVVNHEGIKIVDFKTNYHQTYQDISKIIVKSLNENFAIEFWEYNSFEKMTIENCIIDIINRNIKQIKQKK